MVVGFGTTVNKARGQKRVRVDGCSVIVGMLWSCDVINRAVVLNNAASAVLLSNESFVPFPGD